MKFRDRTKQEALDEIKDLVEKFKRNEHLYKGKDYNEAKTRNDFINKFFEALNWDVSNANGCAERFRDVVVEERIRIHGQSEAPDFSFRIGGELVFYVEAKKPSVNIKDDISPAYQLRRYASSQQLAVSILTDFEEFAVYDTTVKPRATDKASNSRIKYLKYTDYEKEFDYLWNTFSREAVLKGSFDNYVRSKRNYRGTQEIDNSLLETIEGWRKDIAKDIALNNPSVSLRQLNTAVQRIIDRLVFLRIAEDKDMEEYDTLRNTLSGLSIYKKLCEVFSNADRKYNAGLFRKEKWIDTLIISDNTLKGIIENMYTPKCPYVWSVLPVEVLGNIYEKFLGSVITFKNVKGNKHTACVEQKPEVKKAGGVFYTPRYIVEYIVSFLLGNMFAKQTVKTATKITICDPACGSGSFLVGAYRFLLNWYLEQYLKDKEKYLKPQTKHTPNGNVKHRILIETTNGIALSLDEKKRILTTHIFGVDIDEQAVEVCKLSLFLQMLEGEGKEYKEGETLNMFRESDQKILPYMGNNIRCGNSLIGSDCVEVFDNDLFKDEEAYARINPFDWEKAFPQIFADGGFSVVIGNPPYFNVQTYGAKAPEVEYLKSKYSDIWQDKSDILFYFIRKAMRISKGSIGFIVSNAYLCSNKGKKLRNVLLESNKLSRIVNFEEYMVFDEASITTCITLLENKPKQVVAYSVKGKNFTKQELSEKIKDNTNFVKISLEKDKVFALVNSNVKSLNDKIDGNHKKLRELFVIGKGMECAANKVYTFKEYPKRFPAKFIKKRVPGAKIDKFYMGTEEEYLLYFEDIDMFDKLPESVKQHLKENKKALYDRATVKNEGRPWFKYSRPMHKEYYGLNKIWFSYRSKTNAFALDESTDFVGLTNTNVIFDTCKDISLKSLLCLLNSKILTYRYRSIGKQTGGGSYEYFEAGVGSLPIPQIDADARSKLEALCDKAMLWQQKRHEAITDSDKKRCSEFVESVSDEIEEIVRVLYGLTPDELAIIRQSV